ncbi:hypothetical protein B0T14DRAFT_411610, partial [Immersiella caudata]
SLTIDTYFHIVTNSTRAQDGWSTNQTLAEQLQILNTDYARSNITFRLQNISRTINETWATVVGLNTPTEFEMNKALRNGGYSALNIYFRPGLTYADRPANGYCTLPYAYRAGSNSFYRDGCVINHALVPGRTVTHEVGHWFGLLHTFEGGCTGLGDRVADTPAEASASWGCNVTRDTCPNQLGYDPVRNFMDYSIGNCRNHFTAGQITRMWEQWNFFRA